MADQSTSVELIYEPAPPVSESFTEQFNKIVPICPNNRDRYLRFVWGMDRTEYVAGHQERRYADFDGKYIGKPRWVLEGWQSPDVYDKAEWLKVEHLMGPWPENGVWDFIEVLETIDGEFLELDNRALELARSWKFWKSKGHERSVEEAMRQKMLRWSLQQQRREERAAEISAKFGEDAVRILDEGSPERVYSLPPAGFTKTAGGILVKE